MDWTKFLTVENMMFLFGALGWVFLALVILLRIIAPKTETKIDDELLAKLEWLQKNAPLAFLKVKYLHESKQLPSGVDRYAEYLIRLGEAFGSAFGTGSAILPENLQPAAKLIADGLHAGGKLTENPQKSPVSQ